MFVSLSHYNSKLVHFAKMYVKIHEKLLNNIFEFDKITVSSYALITHSSFIKIRMFHGSIEVILGLVSEIPSQSTFEWKLQQQTIILSDKIENNLKCKFSFSLDKMSFMLFQYNTTSQFPLCNERYFFVSFCEQQNTKRNSILTGFFTENDCSLFFVLLSIHLSFS